MDMVQVPKRVVDLLALTQKDGVIKRSTELQEVYRLLAAHNAGATTKQSTLGEQIRQAKAEVATWTPERRAAVRLQGSDPYTQPQATTEAAVAAVALERAKEALRHYADGPGCAEAIVALAEIERIERANGAADAAQLSRAERNVIAERRRQMSEEGFTTARDDGYVDGQLAQAGAAYALAVADHTNHVVNTRAAFYTRSPDIWPWSEKWWKPTSPRRALVKAAALILAGIERIDRAAKEARDADA